jgi:hypothetical protein
VQKVTNTANTSDQISKIASSLRTLGVTLSREWPTWPCEGKGTEAQQGLVPYGSICPRMLVSEHLTDPEGLFLKSVGVVSLARGTGGCPRFSLVGCRLLRSGTPWAKPSPWCG